VELDPSQRRSDPSPAVVAPEAQCSFRNWVVRAPEHERGGALDLSEEFRICVRISQCLVDCAVAGMIGNDI